MPHNETKPTDRDSPHGANPRTGKCNGDAGHASTREAHEIAGRWPPTDTAVKRSRLVTMRRSVTRPPTPNGASWSCPCRGRVVG